jgi:hypothetical protein
MTTAFPPLPVQLAITSITAAVPVPNRQGIVLYISVGALSCPLESSHPRLALLPAVPPSLRPGEPAGRNMLTHGLKER